MNSDTLLDDYRQTVLVAGIGRSGTTWLAEIINHDNAYRYLFEPLHPAEGIPLRETMRNHTYLRPDFRDAALQGAMHDMLTGRSVNAYVEQYDRNPDSPQRLLKTIRISLALKWVQACFPGMPIVYLMRYPGAVISSQMRLGWGSGEHMLNHMLSQEALIAAYLHPFVADMARATDEFERRLFLWCAQLYVLRQQFALDHIHWLHYEQLYTDPVAETRRLFAYLERPFDEDVIQRVVDRPSRTTWRHRRGSPLNRWRDDLTPAQLNRIVEVLELFGLDTLYKQPEMPAEVRAWLRPIPVYAAWGMRLKSLLRKRL